jgi:hypothetical protein
MTAVLFQHEALDYVRATKPDGRGQAQAPAEDQPTLAKSMTMAPGSRCW